MGEESTRRPRGPAALFVIVEGWGVTCPIMAFFSPHPEPIIKHQGRTLFWGGEYVWWPLRVHRKNKPWPPKVPILAPENIWTMRSSGWPSSPDVRTFWQWLYGFPSGKDYVIRHEVDRALNQAVGTITGETRPGGRDIWAWSHDQRNRRILAKVWNQGMENLGYTEWA